MTRALLFIVGGVVVAEIAKTLIAKKVADGIKKEVGSRDPAVLDAADKAGREFANALGARGTISVVAAQLGF
jgi:hypothetical protein